MEPTSSAQVTMDPNSDFGAALDWLIKNAGFPTFGEFSQNPDKWRQNKSEIFDTISDHNTFFKERVANMMFMWRGKYKCKTLEDVERCAHNEGLTGMDLEMEPIAEPMDGTSNLYNSRIKVTVNVWPKDEFRAQGGIVAND